MKVDTAEVRGQAASGFNVLIGTQPFDLWKRH
jgi:hypothetical protein